jgi:hypothetical protein
MNSLLKQDEIFDAMQATPLASVMLCYDSGVEI